MFGPVIVALKWVCHASAESDRATHSIVELQLRVFVYTTALKKNESIRLSLVDHLHPLQVRILLCIENLAAEYVQGQEQHKIVRPAKKFGLLDLYPSVARISRDGDNQPLCPRHHQRIRHIAIDRGNDKDGTARDL